MNKKIVLYYVLSNGESKSFQIVNSETDMNATYDTMLEKLQKSFDNKTKFNMNTENTFTSIDMSKVVSFKLTIE